MGKTRTETGAVAMFPRGAVNHPALFASACVLFDSITYCTPLISRQARDRRRLCDALCLFLWR